MSKTFRISRYFAEHPSATRAEVAEGVGCSVALVAGAVRDGKTYGFGERAGTRSDVARELLLSFPEMRAKMVAEIAGCTVQLVYRLRRET